MPGNGQEGFIFTCICTDYADAGMPTADEAEVFTVACRVGQRDNGLGGIGIVTDV